MKDKHGKARIADLEKKLTEMVKFLSKTSRECGEFLDRTMKENKDVLERLKQAESEEK